MDFLSVRFFEITFSHLYTDCVMLISETILWLCPLVGMVKENLCGVINVAASQ